MAYTLDPGTTTKVVSAVTTTTAAPNTNLDDPRSTTGGSGAYPIFTVQPSSGDATQRVVNFKAKGAGAVPTTVSCTLFSSDDSGASWQTYKASFALVATGTATDVQVSLEPGQIYQVLVTTLTLGSATSVSVDAQAS